MADEAKEFINEPKNEELGERVRQMQGKVTMVHSLLGSGLSASSGPLSF